MAVILLFVVIGVIAFVFWVQRLWRSEPCVVVGQDGQEYAAVIGNHISRYGSFDHFNGIEIQLRKSMPQIYLDSHADHRGPTNFIMESERLSLEGGFDQHFQLFAPHAYHAFTLSILTPDVMHALIKVAHKYDIEIVGRNLRIVSKRLIRLKDRQRVDELLRIASVIAGEIAHQTKGWSARDELHAVAAKLQVRDARSVKIAKHYINTARVALGVAGIPAGLCFVAAGVLYVSGHELWPLALALGWVFAVGYTIMLYKYNYSAGLPMPRYFILLMLVSLAGAVCLIVVIIKKDGVLGAVGAVITLLILFAWAKRLMMGEYR